MSPGAAVTPRFGFAASVCAGWTVMELRMFESALASQVSVALFMALLLAAALSDIAYYKIPNVVVLAMLALYPVFVLVNPEPVDWVWALGVAAIALAIGFTLFATKIFGAGDVKLAVAMLLWAGPGLAPIALLVCAMVGLVIGVVMLSPLRFMIAGALSSIGQRSLGESVLAKNMPYGVAISAGGFFVGWALLAGF